MAKEYTVLGAQLKCPMGTAPSSLIVLPQHRVQLGGKFKANIGDCAPMVNVPPFGLCKSMANPAVAAATAANKGALTPMPCTPTCSIWIGGKTDLLIDGMSALMKGDKAVCPLGASMIEVKDSGQSGGGKQGDKPARLPEVKSLVATELVKGVAKQENIEYNSYEGNSSHWGSRGEELKERKAWATTIIIGRCSIGSQSRPTNAGGDGQIGLPGGSDKKQLQEMEVIFKRNPKHDNVEFRRQLANQEKGMNELTVFEFLKNRKKYKKEGRSSEGNAAQQQVRELAFANKYDELLDANVPPDEALEQANEWIKTQAALHDPDQVAGGDPKKVFGVGDARVNSSIGSQWKSRIDALETQIKAASANMTEADMRNTFLNVRLVE